MATDVKTEDPSTAATLAKTEKNQLSARLAAAERQVLPFDRPSHWRDERVQIHYIYYGGQSVEDQMFIKKTIQHAYSGERTKLYKFFEPYDPWPGQDKAGCIIYRSDDTGPLRLIQAKPGELIGFDPLPAAPATAVAK